MYNCSVCLESKSINEFKINKNCGHICICGDCFIYMPRVANDYINANEIVVCPICRTEGEYMNIYMTEVIRPEEVVTIEEVVTSEGVDTTEENENNNYSLDAKKYYLTKMLDYASSENYNLITEVESRHLYFKDKNILKSNFVEAYFGTEYSYIDGNPKLVDVTKRLAMALAFNKSHLIIEKENLFHNIDIEQSINEKFTLFVIIKN